MKHNNTQYPKPPDGYQPAVRLEYPKMKLQIAALLVVVLGAPALFVLTLIIQRGNMGWLAVTNQVADLLLVLVVVVLTTILHELVHGAAYKLLGYKVSFGISKHLFAAYAAAFKQWQTRNHNLMVALAPLVVFLLLVPLLAVRSHSIVVGVLTALLMNTGGAVGDMYLVWRLLRLPRAALLYDVDDKTMLIFEPVIEN